MLLNLKNTLYAGVPVRVFDARGDEVRYAVECDTQTGRCVVYKACGNWIIQPQQLTTIYVPAPLQIVRRWYR